MGEVVAIGGYGFALFRPFSALQSVFQFSFCFALPKISTYSWRKTKEKITYHKEFDSIVKEI